VVDIFNCKTIVVDWSGASVTPRGLSGSSDAPWKAHWRSGSQPQVMVKSQELVINVELSLGLK